MALIEINGASLYYKVYGDDRPGRAPVLLIHGSTATGDADWGEIAPLLAQDYCVILPDCRGHGRSTNPACSYSFREIAADLATLIHALGHERAHIVGHSNGGNVALVVLMEHPEVVQTAVIQAANAYVSADLVAREPAVFDPERVEREAPEWKEQMIALHGPMHGAEYWRTLLRLTLAETISQPDYEPADLQAVERPVLVIQGAADPVNAPARHAQFIPRHIPYAERWLAAGIGHNVHREAQQEWLRRVRDFLNRRGDHASEALYRLKRDRYADASVTVFEVQARPDERAKAGGRLSGRVMTGEQRAAAAAATGMAADDVQVLLDGASWALVNRAVADLRREPSRLSERLSQALVGDAVRILEERDEWAYVRTEHDGYLGWTAVANLYRCDGAAAQTYGSAAGVTICSELAQAMSEHNGGDAVGKLPFAVALPLVEQAGKRLAVRLPDGRVWWIARSAGLIRDEWLRPDDAGVALALELVRPMVGIPYLWGGCSPFGFDCSGLTQTFHRVLGLRIPRDAHQQFSAGEPVVGSPEPGDLLFFGEPPVDDPNDAERKVERITHVALSLGSDLFIHANGPASAVSYNSLDPTSPLFRPWLAEHYAGARRLHSFL